MPIVKSLTEKLKGIIDVKTSTEENKSGSIFSIFLQTEKEKIIKNYKKINNNLKETILINNNIKG